MTTISPPLALTSLFFRRLPNEPGRARNPLDNGARTGELLGKTADMFKITLAANNDDAGKAKAASIRTLIDNARNLADVARLSTNSLASIVGTEKDLTAVAKLGIAQGKTVTVSDGNKTATYIHSAGNGIEDFVDTINSTAGLKVRASLDADGRLHLDAASINSITIGGSADAAELSNIGLASTTVVGSFNVRRFALAKEYDSIRNKIDAVALKTTGKPAGTSNAKPATGSEPVTAASLGLDRASYIPDGDFQSAAAVAAALADLAAAPEKLATLTSPADRPLAARGEASTRSVLDFFIDEPSDPAGGTANAMLQMARDLRTGFASTPFAIATSAHRPTLRSLLIV